MTKKKAFAIFEFDEFRCVEYATSLKRAKMKYAKSVGAKSLSSIRASRAMFADGYKNGSKFNQIQFLIHDGYTFCAMCGKLLTKKDKIYSGGDNWDCVCGDCATALPDGFFYDLVWGNDSITIGLKKDEEK